VLRLTTIAREAGGFRSREDAFGPVALRYRLAKLGDLWQAVAMGNKDARNREKKKPKKPAPPKVHQPPVYSVNKPTLPKT
jgi:hypothetical protein